MALSESEPLRKKLQQSEEVFKLLVLSVQDYAIFMLDAQGYVKTWNLGAQRIKGYTADEIIGQHFSKFYREEDAAKPPMELKIASEEGHVEDEGWRVRKDGSQFWANVVITALRDELGKIVGFAKVTRDMTERRKADEERAQLIREQAARAEAERSNRVKDEFLAMVSHELRSPLMPILGWTRILRGEKTSRAQLEKGLDVIDRNVRAQVKLIDDLLDVSRIITGKIKLEFREVGLAQVIENAMEQVRQMAEAKNIRIAFALGDSPGLVWGDPDRMQQIVGNILHNAVKFTPQGGSIDVTLRKAGAYAEIEIKDTGEGIDPVFLPHMFNRFSQFDSSSTRKHGGLGLGLSIVRQLVELQSGSVRADSEGPGKGSTFRVRFPIRIMRNTPLGMKFDPGFSESGSALEGKRILVVDDEADVLEILKLTLERCGAIVSTATSVASAIEICRKDPPQVVVSDIGMPEEDGYSLVKKLRQLGDIPAIAVTAFARSEDRIRALDAGFCSHVAKPVNPDELCTVVVASIGKLG
jgi:PAS domain S-box-containing protein